MRGFPLLIMALACGFAGGAALNHMIAIASSLLFDSDMHLPRGLGFLPMITSILCAVTVMVWQPGRKK